MVKLEPASYAVLIADLSIFKICKCQFVEIISSWRYYLVDGVRSPPPNLHHHPTSKFDLHTEEADHQKNHSVSLAGTGWLKRYQTQTN